MKRIDLTPYLPVTTQRVRLKTLDGQSWIEGDIWRINSDKKKAKRSVAQLKDRGLCRLIASILTLVEGFQSTNNNNHIKK